MNNLAEANAEPGHKCPACGAPHRAGWLYRHTCGHNGCKHQCTIVNGDDPLYLTTPLPSGDNPLYA